MATALQLFGEAVAQVAGHVGRPAPRSKRPGVDGVEPRLTRAGRRMTDVRRSRRCATRSPSSSATATPSPSRASPISSGSRPATRSSASGKRDLTLARLTPDVIYDQMIAGGVASKLVFSWLGNPGVGGLGAIRRRIEGDIPDEPLAVEEYSHFGMVGRYTAGAMNLPFFPLR